MVLSTFNLAYSVAPEQAQLQILCVKIREENAYGIGKRQPSTII